MAEGEDFASADAEVGRRLAAERPVPRAGFRAELRSSLMRSQGSEVAPRRLGLLIAAYAGSGAALLILAGLGLAGSGPLGA
jgi:hypothetical protein